MVRFKLLVVPLFPSPSGVNGAMNAFVRANIGQIERPDHVRTNSLRSMTLTPINVRSSSLDGLVNAKGHVKRVSVEVPATDIKSGIAWT